MLLSIYAFKMLYLGIFIGTLIMVSNINYKVSVYDDMMNFMLFHMVCESINFINLSQLNNLK